MKRFKTKKNVKGKVDFVLLIILVTTLFILHFYNSNISPKIIDIAEAKLEEITTLYIKKDIMPTVDLDQLITIHQNTDGEIIYVDIDQDYANSVMVDVVEKIQKNIFSLEEGDILTFQNNRELKSYKGNLYLLIPIGLSYDGLLFSNIGPKIPIKVSFFEHVLGNIDTSVTSYGINNALLKVYMTISLEQKLIIPYQNKKFSRDYTVIIGTKVINGTVPSFYGSAIRNSSNLMEQ